MGIFTTIMPSSKVASTYAGFPMDMDDWNCEQWKQYYLRNKAALGKAEAVSIVNNDSYRIGTFANVHSCAYDCDWSKFMASEGLDPSNIFSIAWCSIKSVGQTVQNTTEIASNVSSAVKTATSSNLVTLALIAGGVYVGYKTLVK